MLKPKNICHELTQIMRDRVCESIYTDKKPKSLLLYDLTLTERANPIVKQYKFLVAFHIILL